jgi:hypothetical protein
VTVSGFIRTGRAKKVHAMLRIVDSVIANMPPGTSDAEAAERFKRFRQDDRNRVALLAGVRIPSEDTWQAFIVAVRERGGAPQIADMRDAPVPEHDCDQETDDTNHCRVCGASQTETSQ